MPVETEWRFLVTRLPAVPGAPFERIEQSYFLTDPPFAGRVRLRNGHGTLTFKGMRAHSSPGQPVTRPEYEYEIPARDAREMLDALPRRIVKRRYDLEGGMELDIFEEEFAGLVIAEFEVSAGTPPPDPPAGWAWTDISHDERYTNVALQKNGLPPGCPLALGKE